MLKNRTMFIGLGQAGSNICYEFEKLDYTTLLINTSLEDLNSIKLAKHKYHIANSSGSGRDRELSKQLFSDDIENIATTVDNIASDKDIIFVAASSSGGTGAGSMPEMINLLQQLYPDKLVCGITVLPDERIESVMACNNCYDTLKELSEIDMGALFILDNKKCSNKFTINQEFVVTLDRFLTLDNTSKNGNIDETELYTLLSTPRYAIITKLSKDKTSVANIIQSFNNNIYAPLENDHVVTYTGYVLAKTIELTEVETELGTGLDTFIGYGANSTLCICTGLSIPTTRINEIFDKVKQNQDRINNNMSQLGNSSLNEQRITFNKPVRRVLKKTGTSNREDLLKRLRG